MDEGLIQLLFFGAIILASVVDSIKRAKAKGKKLPTTAGLPPPGPEPGLGPETSRGPLREYEVAGSTTYGDDEEEEPQIAGGPIPRGFWEEISALAEDQATSGEEAVARKLPPVPLEREVPPAPAAAPTAAPGRQLVVRESRAPEVVRGYRAVETRKSHSNRDWGEVEAVPVTGPPPSALGVRGVRAAGRGGLRRTLRNARELRRAVLMYEILGPPVALRDED